MASLDLETARPKARIAVLGAGWWSQGWHLPHLSRNAGAELVAVVDPNPAPRSTLDDLEPLAVLGARYGVPVFDSLGALLASAVGVDGVVVCTPHATHASLGAEALAHGLHVLVEKPMTTDVAEADALRAAARAAPSQFFAVNNTACWRSRSRTAAAWVARGRIGSVEHVSCVFHAPLLWLFDDPLNVGWTRRTGGMAGNGLGWGQMSHVLAWALMVSGVAPTAVFCKMTFSAKSGADLTDAAVFETASGATLVVSGACTVPGDAHGASARGKRVALTVLGSDGELTYGGDDQDEASGRLALHRRDGASDAVEGFDFENYDRAGDGPESVRAFVDACRGDADAFRGADADVGRDVVACIAAMYESAASGARVEIAPRPA